MNTSEGSSLKWYHRSPCLLQCQEIWPPGPLKHLSLFFLIKNISNLHQVMLKLGFLRMIQDGEQTFMFS